MLNDLHLHDTTFLLHFPAGGFQMKDLKAKGKVCKDVDIETITAKVKELHIFHDHIASDKDIQKIAEKGAVVLEFQKGFQLFQQGDHQDIVFAILEGTIGNSVHHDLTASQKRESKQAAEAPPQAEGGEAAANGDDKKDDTKTKDAVAEAQRTGGDLGAAYRNLQAGDYFGELGFLKHIARSSTATVTSDTARVLAVSR